MIDTELRCTWHWATGNSCVIFIGKPFFPVVIGLPGDVSTTREGTKMKQARKQAVEMKWVRAAQDMIEQRVFRTTDVHRRIT